MSSTEDAFIIGGKGKDGGERRDIVTAKDVVREGGRLRERRSLRTGRATVPEICLSRLPVSLSATVTFLGSGGARCTLNTFSILYAAGGAPIRLIIYASGFYLKVPIKSRRRTN